METSIDNTNIIVRNNRSFRRTIKHRLTVRDQNNSLYKESKERINAYQTFLSKY